MRRERMTHRSSVLDALLGSAKSLHGDLNPTDRDKLDQYLNSVREVERRCRRQGVVDRPVRTGHQPIEDEERMHIEEMPLFFDLLTLALQTDSTRRDLEIPLGFSTTDLDGVSTATTVFLIIARGRTNWPSFRWPRIIYSLK